MVSKKIIFRGWLVGLLAALVAALVAGPARAQRPSIAKLLPEKTILLLSVPDAREVSKRFLNTSLGRISQDPQMQPLVKYLYGSLAEAVAGVREQIGLSLAELSDIPQRELALAMVAQEDEPPALVALIDTGSEIAKARTLLQHGIDAALKHSTNAAATAGTGKSEETVAGTTLKVYDGPGPRDKIAFFEKDGTIVAGNSVSVLKGMLDAWKGGKASTLADSRKYSEAVGRCRGDKGETPQVVFFFDPIGLIRATSQGNPGVQVGLAMLPTLGLDGLQAVAASLALDTSDFDMIFQAHLLLDQPRSGVPDLIALEPTETNPEPWVPGDVVQYATLRWKYEKTFKGVGKLVDSFRGEGTFDKDVNRNVQRLTGLDLTKDILPLLQGRLTYVTWLERPITPTSPATLVAFRLKNAESAGKLFDSVVARNEKSMTRLTAAGRTFYQIGPQLSRPGSDAPSRPGPCVGILDDYLIFTDRPALWEKVAGTAANPAESLGKALDFKLIASRIKRRAGSAKPGAISFGRPEERMRMLYELAAAEGWRQRVQRGGGDPVLRTLGSALEANPLPPFAVIERYMAPTGAILTDDESGLHYTAFSLKRK